MNFETMTIEQVEARLAEIRSLNIDAMTAEEVDATTAEVEGLEQRKAALVADVNARKELRAKVATGAINTTPITNEGETEMPNVMTRDSLEYGQAFIRAFKTGKFEEVRTMLTENASGTIAVPTQLETEVRTAWEENTLLSLAHVTYEVGDVKIPFELESSDANNHTEGATDDSAEGTITYGYVDVKASNIIKWVTASVESIENTTMETLTNIYRDLAHKIVEKAASNAIAKMIAAPAESTATACAVPVLETAALAEDTITNLVALLSGKAKDVHLVMNRRTRAAFKGIVVKGKYMLDVFDGLDDKIIYTDALPAVQTLTELTGQTVVIAGDFGYGLRVNKPNGNSIKTILDEVSLASIGQDKVIGRQFVGIEVEAPKAISRLVMKAN